MAGDTLPRGGGARGHRAARGTCDPHGHGRTHGFRGDVEGLRAVAVGTVLAYHAAPGPVTGGYVGVDVFFVLSGFLITSLLLRELESSGTISLAGFYARRARRLLPLTVVVLVSVTALAHLVMSPVERRSVFGDVVASALYATNWRQARQAVDYSAVGTQASPVQHFWSLAVEEQFYLVWPLLLLAVGWWCRRTGRRLRPRLALVLGGVAAASFAYSVHLTPQAGGVAYFSTLTRAWELAAGGLLALLSAHRWHWPRRLPGAVALAGLAAVLAAAVGLDDDTPFPGTAALLPVLGAVAVVAAGAASADHAVARLLTLRPVRYVGRISYAWYLWHWPAVVFATAWTPEPSAYASLSAVALSFVPAAATHRLVEEPFRRSRAFVPTRPALWLGAACTAVSVLVGAVSWASVPTVRLAPPAQARGAEALQGGGAALQEAAEALRPVPEDATEDKGEAFDDGCLVPYLVTESPDCVYGDESSDTTVVLFGDSHALQYAPALDRLAQRRGWRLVVLAKSSCTPADIRTYDRRLKREYTECAAWRTDSLRRIEREDPRLVVTGNRATTRAAGPSGGELDARASAEALVRGYARTLRRLVGTGAEVVVMADNPHPPEDVPSCVSRSLHRLADCAFDEGEGRDHEPTNIRAAEAVPGVRLVDPAPVLCPGGTCPAVIGNVLVYRNGAHVTASYMRTMTDWLDGELPAVRRARQRRVTPGGPVRRRGPSPGAAGHDDVRAPT